MQAARCTSNKMAGDYLREQRIRIGERVPPKLAGGELVATELFHELEGGVVDVALLFFAAVGSEPDFLQVQVHLGLRAKRLVLCCNNLHSTQLTAQLLIAAQSLTAQSYGRVESREYSCRKEERGKYSG